MVSAAGRVARSQFEGDAYQYGIEQHTSTWTKFRINTAPQEPSDGADSTVRLLVASLRGVGSIVVQSCSTGFRNVPTFSISMLTRSPASSVKSSGGIMEVPVRSAVDSGT